MLEAIISGLVLAGVSGLAFMAYRHTSGYKRIIRPLKVSAIIAYIILAAYGFGFSSGSHSNGEPLSFSLGKISLMFLGFWAITMVLDILPEMLTHDDRKKDADDEPPDKA